MAIMIPRKPYYFDEKSQEDLMFKALESLPNDYYVFHSFRIYKEIEGYIRENEIDFLIYNREKGILVLEAKAGQISCKEGIWYYQSGEQMNHGGPFEQVLHNKWRVSDLISNNPRVSYLVNKCKICCGVWLIAYSKDDVYKLNFPPDVDKKMIMTKESLIDPLEDVERIFSLKKHRDVDTNLNDLENREMLLKVLCPEFNVVPTETFEADLKRVVFHRLLKEQSLILNFLTEQKNAIINGAAGTGKTLIAVQKALRHADNGEKVLFLCFNNALQVFLDSKYKNEKIDFYTISGYACKICGTSSPDYMSLNNELENYYLMGDFPYKHIVIDEGQDFGIDEIEKSKVMITLKMIADSIDGTFYVFYDKLQLIQAKQMPDFIKDADCKLTLYKNCRNTKNIAVTSLRPITERKVELIDDAPIGDPANMFFCEDSLKVVEVLDQLINNYKAKGLKDIVILTMKTEDTSLLSKKVEDGYYRKNYLFTTCRKFKGLESDVIILIDIDESAFVEGNKLLFYVGSSRARLKLDVITTLDDDQCINILVNDFSIEKKIKNGRKELSHKLNMIPKN